jgi:shikimate dehydrogenase
LLFAVTGSPVSDSKSPDIWNSTFKALNIDATYFRIASQDIGEAIKTAEELYLRGLNITAPFKEDVLRFVSAPDKDVQSIGAANVILFEDRKIKAFNTDWKAVTKILNDKDLFELQNKKCLVLGAGGAARAAVYALKKLNADIVISNRTQEKARRLASYFNVEYLIQEDALKESYDLVINCTSRSYDVFPELKTKLLLDAPYSGLISSKDYVSGEEWLILQAETLFRNLFEEDATEYMKKGLLELKKRTQNIALTGFMGSGKSYLARKLAKELSYELVDLDELIEEQEGMSVTQIFSTKGGEYFREKEKKLLHSLELKRPLILATGGGTIIDPENREFLKSNFNVVWLWAKLGVINKRIDRTNRPLFNDNAKELLNSRIPLYAKSCDFCVRNSDSDVKKVISIIRANLPR